MINGFPFLKRANSIWKIYDITQFRGSYYSPLHIFAQWKLLSDYFKGPKYSKFQLFSFWFFSMFHQGHPIFITFNERITLQKCKKKIVRPCPYATLNPFGNINVMLLFWLHQYSPPTSFSDWNAMRICVIVNTTLREPRGCGDACGWGEGLRGVGTRVGAWLRPPPPDGWQAGGTHPARMLTDTQPWPINRIYVLTDCTVKSAPFQVVRCTLNW